LGAAGGLQVAVAGRAGASWIELALRLRLVGPGGAEAVASAPSTGRPSVPPAVRDLAVDAVFVDVPAASRAGPAPGTIAPRALAARAIAAYRRTAGASRPPRVSEQA
jgi:hypothetical protein